MDAVATQPSSVGGLDCFVALRLAMTTLSFLPEVSA
jgi:hypothetical protein